MMTAAECVFALAHDKRPHCDGRMIIGQGTHRKVRGFQPPWRTVIDHACPKCGGVVTLNANWRGSPPPGAIVCGRLL